MRKIGFAGAVAAMGLMLTAGGASAAIVVQTTVANQLYALNSGVMLEDFDAIHSPLTSFTGLIVGPFGDNHSVNGTAPPPYDDPNDVNNANSITVCCQGNATYEGDPTKYASVQANQTSTFTVLGGRYLTNFSFYMGSPDSYNKLTFNFVGGGSQDLVDTAIWGGDPPGNGNRTNGFRVYYDFNGAKVSSITFASTQNAFEFDGLAGTVVPEPGTWALMILGFGGVGAMLRNRRRLVAA
jgi:hypothetical protein